MSRYRVKCPNNTECTYQESFTTNYVINTENKKCPECDTGLICESEELSKNNAASALLSGVGDINSRLPSDFRDLLQKIKNGSPGSNMKDYK